MRKKVNFSFYIVETFIDDFKPVEFDGFKILEELKYFEPNRQLFDKLSAFYLNNRYPDFISKLSIQIEETEAKEILTETKEAFAWLLTLKP